jgi:VWFA-related protein
MVPRSLVASVAVLLISGFCLAVPAQTNSQSGYTFQANSRVVLTDVTVTDKQGNPVHGLKVSDFQIFDNNKLQQIASFEEHTGSETAPAQQSVSTPGVYSNDYLVHPPRVLNVILLDLTNMAIEDQMYLNYQLGKFFDELTPEEPVAIYARTGGASILLQTFTSDHALLRAAVKRIMPRFPPLGREYLSDIQTLQQIEQYLAQIPGRKNVLWFTGRLTFSLNPDATLLAGQSGWMDVYDELESARIAIYPIDARGLTTALPPGMLADHAIMSDVAHATGGRAVYDYNGLALAAEEIVQHDGAYYTLTYSPRDFVYNNKWHKVRVAIPETNYTLRYRSGYFADGTSSAVQKRPERSRTRLLPHGRTETVQPSRNASPIIFQARVHEGVATASGSTSGAPEKLRRGTRPFTVEYTLPLDAFAIESAGGKATVTCDAAVLAFNDNGTLIARHGHEITFTLKDDAAAHPAGKLLPVDVEVDLPKGNVYLFVAAWDPASKRLGTLEIPYSVAREHPPQQTSTLK